LPTRAENRLDRPPVETHYGAVRTMTPDTRPEAGEADHRATDSAGHRATGDAGHRATGDAGHRERLRARLLAGGGDGLGDGAIGALKFVEAVALRSLRTAALDRPVLSGWQALTDYLHAAMAHRVTEEFRVIFLNNRNVMIRDEAMGQGTVNQAPVYPREIVKRALELGASGLVLVHNHPSGDPQPSRDDITMTKAVIEAGRHLGLVVHDHVIIGRGGHVSMRAQGLI
jgi:DNA repair protein RadC